MMYHNFLDNKTECANQDLNLFCVGIRTCTWFILARNILDTCFANQSKKTLVKR
jgi:hypothetical protein